MKTYKIGVIGFAHMHVLDLLKRFVEMRERVEFIGCYDLPPEVPTLTDQESNRYRNIERAIEMTGMPKLHSVSAIIKEKPDLVIVCTENARHSEVCSRLLLKGIHVLVEKPMAPTLAQALQMFRAAKLGKAELIVNWPSTWMPAVRTGQRLVQEGAIGKPFRFHYRNASSKGPFEYGQSLSPAEKAAEWWHQDFTGGGATMDYCCYGSCLARWYLGADPIAAYGVRANFAHQFSSADDYGTITASFPEAVAIVEGSWVTVHSGDSNGPIVMGLEGTLIVDDNQVRIFNKYHSNEPPVIIPADSFPGGRNTIAKEVLHHFDTGEALHPTLDTEVNLGAMMMLDAGIRASKSGKQELAGSNVYTIGE